MVLSLLLKAGIFVILLKTALPLHRRDTDASSVDGMSSCENGWLHKGKFCYQLEKHRMSWDRAACHCLRKGGHLASIHSKEQQEFFTDYILKEASMRLWIGLHDTGFEGEYMWEDGSRIDYKNWDIGEPSGHADIKEDCVEMRPDVTLVGSWNDAPCNYEKGFICQKPTQENNHSTVLKNNRSGSGSVTIVIITIIFIVTLMAQTLGIFYYRKLWMEGKREKVSAVVFKTEVPESDSTDVNEENYYTDDEPRYARL